MVFKVPRLRLSLHPQIPPRMQLQRYKKNGRTAKIQKKWPFCKTFTKKVAIYSWF